MPCSTKPDLTNLNTKELRALFQATLGIPTVSNNRPWMITRISTAPAAPVAPPVVPVAVEPSSAATKPLTPDPAPAASLAMPAVGSQIRKTFRGKQIVVTVHADGFRLNGTVYRSLSAAATALCGGNRNGLVFFGLKSRPATATTVAVHAQAS